MENRKEAMTQMLRVELEKLAQLTSEGVSGKVLENQHNLVNQIVRGIAAL